MPLHGVGLSTYTDNTGASKETDHNYIIPYGYDRERKTRPPTPVMLKGSVSQTAYKLLTYDYDLQVWSPEIWFPEMFSLTLCELRLSFQGTSMKNIEKGIEDYVSSCCRPL